jgi:hypothetical protein
VSRALKWWWRWVGPHSLLGPVLGAVLFVLSILALVPIFAPPMIWLVAHTIVPVVAWWWRLWVLA